MNRFTTLLITLACSSALFADDAPKRPDAAGAGAGKGREKIQEMMIQRFDANKNGQLDPEERAAAMKAMQDRKGGAPGAGAAKGAGGKGMEMVLQRFDANKNGKLDPEEREAAMKAYQGRKNSSASIPGNDSGGSKFRRPPEAPKEGEAPKK